MKSVRVAFLSCVVVILQIAACRAEDSELRTVLEGRYAALKSAMTERDADQVAALLAPDFVAVDVAGRRQTGSRMIDGLKKALPVDPDKVSKTTLLSVESSGSTAIVKQRYNLTGFRVSADRKKHPAELTTLSTDVWVSMKGTWLLQRSTTDQMDYVVDGKSLMHKVRKSEP